MYFYLFRELVLNHNLLRILPYEIGKLFNLLVLGLHGNPLGKEIMNTYTEPNGVTKLLQFMLDNLQGKWSAYNLETKKSISILAWDSY